MKLKLNSRVEVWSKNNVRLAVISGEKKTFFTAKRPHLLAFNAFIAVNFFVRLAVNLAVNFCKISDFSGEKIFFHRFVVELKIFFSPHYASSGEKIFSPLKR